MMKKKNRIQIASQIIAQLKREMQEPRLTESVPQRYIAPS